MIHKLTINLLSLNHINNNHKNIEGRLKRGYFVTNPILIGDIIEFYNKNYKCIVQVTNITEYTGINEYLSSEPIKYIIPETDNILEALSCYEKYYTKKKLYRFPILAIKFTKL